MGNMCCRREMYAPNGAESDQSRCNGHKQESGVHQHTLSKQQHQQTMSSAYHSAGDDCAINELLEGRMDLDVLMPDGRQVRLTVERRTPMMDLLVQAASATKISPGGHVIHVFGDGDKGNNALQYKPSTPIGSLDTKTICIVPKKEHPSDPLARRMGKTANRPFEPTFRVQVHLPRNQLTVLRVSPRIKIADLKTMVCKEKGLDTGRYQLVRPSGPTQPLAGDMTLAEYGSTEITLLSNSSIESHICNSTSHIIPYPKRAADTKRRNGILRLLTEDAINKANETTSCSPTYRIDGPEIKTSTPEEAPHTLSQHHGRYKPKKRRPAPPPPPPVLPEAPSHSRQSSSDSSGYHEATSSFLHEENSGEEKASSDSSGVSSLDAKVPTLQPQQQEPSPPAVPPPNLKKKRAPAPPPPSRHKERPHHRQAPACPVKKVCSTTLVDSGKTDHTTSKTDLAEKSTNFPLAYDNPIDPTLQAESHLEQEQQPNLVSTPPLIINKDSTTAGPAVSLPSQNSIIESSITTNGPAVTTTTEFTISSYVTDPIIPGDDDIVRGDYLAARRREQKDRMLSSNRNHIIPAKDHIIPKDPLVPNQSTDDEKKLQLDLPRLWESEGRRLDRPQVVTVAANALPAANVSTTVADPVKEDEIKYETVSADEGIPDTTNRYRTSEKKAGEDPYKGESVSTRVALVALSARLEQDVTQQEIASSIRAAFHSVDFSPQQPSLLAIKQRTSDDWSITRSVEDIPSSDSPPPQTTTVRVPLNFRDESDRDSPRSTDSESLSEKVLLPPESPLPTPDDSDEFPTAAPKRSIAREALLIDEDPSPSSRPVGTPSKGLKRSSSLLNFTDSPKNAPIVHPRLAGRHLQRSLTDLSTGDKEDFEAEQQRLQQEYIKLQRQFIVWQQQLMNNHAMLREECIVPQYARTLRQSHSLPEGEDSFDDTTTPSVPLVSRSLSYEPTKKDRCCSTLPRSAINITSLEFGSIPLSNGNSTLRSSKTKSYFKPPQVRASTKNRQRLPPEIKREGDVDITDDAKMLTTILPSFESLKLITENHEDVHFGNSRLKDVVKSDTPAISSAGGRKIPVVHLSSTFPKLKLNNGDRDLKCVNGNSNGQFVADCSPTGQSPKSLQQPPPPPPMPLDSAPKCPVVVNCFQSTGRKNGVIKKDFAPHAEDPRERLMLEIRKFGGRTALRKISLAS